MASSNIGGGEFWVYENFPANRARVHIGDCRYCNHGKGVSGGGCSKNVRWHGPCDTRESAFSAMAKLGRKDAGACAVCKP